MRDLKYYLGYLGNTALAKLKPKHKTSSNHLLDPKFIIQENRLKSTIEFIQKTTITRNHKKIKLKHLPWYFLIGDQGCGKTTLLSKSNVHFISKEQSNLADRKEILPTEHYDFWITADSVIIDTPGNQLMFKEKKMPAAHRFWKSFIELVQQYQPHEMGGIIFAISMHELVDKKLRNNLVQNLKYHIKTLREKFGNDLPFYFSITKCDLLPGFTDFFNDFAYEELLQAWGITMPNDQSEILSNIFMKRFNALIKRLNSQVIWRLHRERNSQRKFFIKNFPLQIEHVKEALLDVFKSLENAESKFLLKGLYLTSATQQQISEKPKTEREIVQLEELPKILEIMYNPESLKNSYFIKQFILQGIMQ